MENSSNLFKDNIKIGYLPKHKPLINNHTKDTLLYTPVVKKGKPKKMKIELSKKSNIIESIKNFYIDYADGDNPNNAKTYVIFENNKKDKAGVEILDKNKVNDLKESFLNDLKKTSTMDCIFINKPNQN